MRMIIVSGYSGAGKSIALDTLEDLNYYCVDNLPLPLLKPFAEAALARNKAPVQTAAVGIDARNFVDELERFPEILAELRHLGLAVEILFLQASDEVLLKRYSETRRRHPLGQVPLVDAIRQERRLLDSIREHANLIIDTSRTNIHELRQQVRARLHETPSGGVSILFKSFGYKNGIPADADFVFDVRCLPNPHWEPRLRPLNGCDAEVIAFLDKQSDVNAMIADLRQFLNQWIPRFESGSRSYLTVAIGCTGGQHRSVYIVETLAREFRDRYSNVTIRHRELA